MNMSLSMYEWHGPQVPTQQEIIKDLHQQLMVKELRIKALVEVRLVEADAEIEKGKRLLRKQLNITNERTMELISANAEIERLEKLRTIEIREAIEARAELAASQLREKVLREALVVIAGQGEDREVASFAEQALQTPTNDSALRNYVADEMVKMGEYCRSPWLSTVTYIERYRNGDL